jgi:hypothetical protein
MKAILFVMALALAYSSVPAHAGGGRIENNFKILID